MNYIVSIEGQTINIPPEIAENDDQVRQALAPFFPDAANALITRKVDGETTMISVVKRAGSKGLDPREELQACAGGRNPAVDLYSRLMAEDPAQMTPEVLLTMDGEIQEAIREGEEQAETLESALQRLRGARPVAAPVLPLGF